VGTRHRLKSAIGTAAILIVVGAGVAYTIYRDKLAIDLPDYPPVKQVRWPDQGWSRDERNWFHHADQGTQTLNIPYEWFIALEQPRLSLVGDVGRLNDPAYLDRYGFIPGATEGGEIQLPIGFARGETMRTLNGSAWLNPRTGQPMRGIGLTCAACHTGRLTYKETALVIDGGPALTDLGKFRQGLGISVLFTKWVPGRFDRFARNVLGEDASEKDKAALRKQLRAVWNQLDIVRRLDKDVYDRGVVEGYGRLDALNRIGNQIFALDLGEEGRMRNYAPTTAPVNFPHIWSTSWFDWVQYNASIQQPMVRNAGEALGVSAPVNLVDPARALFATGVQVQRLAEIEKQLAGAEPSEKDGFTGLHAPGWPADVFVPDPPLANEEERARAGAGLYAELCAGCHLPPVGSKDFWASKNWLPPNEFGKRYLHVEVLPLAKIGTDPAQAQDMLDRKVWAPASLGLPSDAFGEALGKLVEKTVANWYDSRIPPVPASERDGMNGFRPNGIRAPLAVKARPLNGVWATPPFLHNGSVPNVYAMLSPAAQRPKAFYLGRREYDPVCMGYALAAKAAPGDQPDARCLGEGSDAEAGRFAGIFRLDTSLRGNRNTGHEFDDRPLGNGVIGRRLSEGERLAIVEFLKSDCANAPKEKTSRDTSCIALGYPSAPAR